ncbi:MAG: carbohydrate kinase family protein [Chloroflexi bacterium]|nr:carbohydrate kinase family protein [Chloroflexota bacterium]
MSAGRRPAAPARAPSAPRSRPTIVVVGDLMLDVSIAPAAPLRSGTDVPGTVRLRQGGSAANTARWAARLGARSALVCAVGRDATGRSLVRELRIVGVRVRALRVAGLPTGRIGIVVAPDGERSFVADRGAADGLGPDRLDAAWFAGADAVHLPAYSLLGEPLGSAGRRAAALGRAAGAIVSVDLASAGPLLAGGRVAARTLIARIAPDLLFATAAEAEALMGVSALDRLDQLADVVVIKRGARGASVLARTADGGTRLDVPTATIATEDTTGAGDAFDAGFLVTWLAERSAGRAPIPALRRAAVAGNRAAARQLTRPRREIAVASGAGTPVGRPSGTLRP